MAALTMAREGVPCRLLERTIGAADKVCGEFLSAEAVARLSALRFPWAQASAAVVHNVRVEAFGRTVGMPLPFEARSVSRAYLDVWLLQQARAAGVDVQEGVYVRDIQRSVDGFVLRTESESLPARTLVLATGKHALARFHPRTPASGPKVVGWKMNFHNLGRSLQEALAETLGLFFFEGGYGGISIVGQDTATVSLLVQPKILQSSGTDSLALLETLAPQLPLLRLVLAESTPIWPRPKTVANVPYGHCDADAPAGLFAVGDQFAVLPSFTGTGISFAMASGVLAGKHIAASPYAVGSALYAREARTMARKVLRRALPLHRLLQHAAFSKVAMAALGLLPALLPIIARSTRVPETPFAKDLA